MRTSTASRLARRGAVAASRSSRCCSFFSSSSTTDVTDGSSSSSSSTSSSSSSNKLGYAWTLASRIDSARSSSEGKVPLPPPSFHELKNGTSSLMKQLDPVVSSALLSGNSRGALVWHLDRCLAQLGKDRTTGTTASASASSSPSPCLPRPRASRGCDIAASPHAAEESANPTTPGYITLFEALRRKVTGKGPKASVPTPLSRSDEPMYNPYGLAVPGQDFHGLAEVDGVAAVLAAASRSKSSLGTTNASIVSFATEMAKAHLNHDLPPMSPRSADLTKIAQHWFGARSFEHQESYPNLSAVFSGKSPQGAKYECAFDDAYELMVRRDALVELMAAVVSRLCPDGHSVVRACVALATPFSKASELLVSNLPGPQVGAQSSVNLAGELCFNPMALPVALSAGVLGAVARRRDWQDPVLGEALCTYVLPVLNATAIRGARRARVSPEEKSDDSILVAATASAVVAALHHSRDTPLVAYDIHLAEHLVGRTAAWHERINHLSHREDSKDFDLVITALHAASQRGREADLELLKFVRTTLDPPWTVTGIAQSVKRVFIR